MAEGPGFGVGAMFESGGGGSGFGGLLEGGGGWGGGLSFGAHLPGVVVEPPAGRVAAHGGVVAVVHTA